MSGIDFRFRDGVPLRPGNKYRINRDGNIAQLIVKDIHEGDSGEITCEVSNAKGHDTATCKLEVQSRSSIIVIYVH